MQENIKKEKITQNPLSFGAMILAVVGFIIWAIGGGWATLIPLIIGERRLAKAKKENEKKKFITIGYIMIYLNVAVWVISSFLWAWLQVKMAK